MRSMGTLPPGPQAYQFLKASEFQNYPVETFGQFWEEWQRHRRLMQPAFQQKYLDQLHHTLMTCIQKAIAQWADHPQSVPLDFATEMTQLTLKIVSLALFSLDISDRSSDLGQACRHAIEYVYGRMANPLSSAQISRLRLILNLRCAHDMVFRSGYCPGSLGVNLIFPIQSGRNES